MVVIKTKTPLRRVFFKEPAGEGFSGIEMIDEPQADPLADERMRQALEEKLAEARAEFEAELKEKEDQAFERGKKEGEEAARQEIETRAAQLASVISSLDQARQMILSQAEETVLELSLAVARRFVESSALYGNDLIKQTIKSAVKMVTEKEKVIIRINPDDLEQVRAHQDDIIFIGDGIGKLEIRPDKKVDRGGCVVETEAGNIDARIESRFAEIEKAMKQVFQAADDGEKKAPESDKGTDK